MSWQVYKDKRIGRRLREKKREGNGNETKQPESAKEQGACQMTFCIYVCNPATVPRPSPVSTMHNWDAPYFEDLPLTTITYQLYCATCQSSLSAHSLSFNVNNTSATSLAPFPLKQLISHHKRQFVSKSNSLPPSKKKKKTHMTISLSLGKLLANCIPPQRA